MKSDTRILFHRGLTEATARVLHCQPGAQGQAWLITDQTPFHPLSHLWPDQPGDRGWLEIEGQRVRVVNALTGAIGPDQVLQVDQAIEHRRGAPDCAFVVVHCLDGSAPEPVPGQPVHLRVDGERRRSISLAHSACHLASLALNQTLEPFWRKDPGLRDGGGHIDFDRIAISRSRLYPGHSVDHYRIGKSLRKRGFQAQSADRERPAIQQQVNQQIGQWLDRGARIQIEAESEHLSATRHWLARFDGGPIIRIPCGGTHVRDLAEFANIDVSLQSEAQSWRMETRAHAQQTLLND